MGVENNIYMQIALIMLIGLLTRTPSDHRVRPRTTPIRHEHRLGSRTRASARLRPDPDDLAGTVISLAADVRQRRRSQRQQHAGNRSHRRYVDRYDLPDLRRTGAVRRLPASAGTVQAAALGTIPTAPKSKQKSNNTRNNGDEKTTVHIYRMPCSAGSGCNIL